MLSLLFATTSLGVVLPVLEETGYLRHPLGQAILYSAVIADFMTMLLVSLLLGAHATDNPWRVGLTLAILPIALGVGLGLWKLRSIPAAGRLLGQGMDRTRATIALVALFAMLADMTGSEPILGAFLAGMIVRGLSFAYKPLVEMYSYGVGYAVFVPMFFVATGYTMPIAQLHSQEALYWLPVFAAMAFAVKLLPAHVLLYSHGRRQTWAAGFLLSSTQPGCSSRPTRCRRPYDPRNVGCLHHPGIDCNQPRRPSGMDVACTAIPHGRQSLKHVETRGLSSANVEIVKVRHHVGN
ncbi:hypothetical protein GCM10025858_07640 [Alicyclobacillus sacchari]|nr:hypothetical protein GCM10025858_07640 [Alicyclobacillus sacchari]